MKTNELQQRQRRIFIDRRIKADFEETCKTPHKCAKSMYPTSCDECGWNADKVIDSAEQAADRFAAADGE